MNEFYLAINKCQFAKQQHTHVRAIISFFLCLSTNKTFTGFDIDYAGIIIISIYTGKKWCQKKPIRFRGTLQYYFEYRTNTQNPNKVS
jgi:short subunit fatty acids transporter